jgi:hypothetical protein
MHSEKKIHGKEMSCKGIKEAPKGMKEDHKKKDHDKKKHKK